MEPRLLPSAYLPIRAVLSVLEFYNPELFVDLRESLRGEFSTRQRPVAFPIQRNQTNEYGSTACDHQVTLRGMLERQWRGQTTSRYVAQNANANAKLRQGT